MDPLVPGAGAPVVGPEVASLGSLSRKVPTVGAPVLPLDAASVAERSRTADAFGPVASGFALSTVLELADSELIPATPSSGTSAVFCELPQASAVSAAPTAKTAHRFLIPLTPSLRAVARPNAR